jgi:hypothetical protein
MPIFVGCDEAGRIVVNFANLAALLSLLGQTLFRYRGVDIPVSFRDGSSTRFSPTRQ